MSVDVTAIDGGASGPHVRVKVTKNTKGYSWETSCTLLVVAGQEAVAFQRALDAVADANADLKRLYGAEE